MEVSWFVFLATLCLTLTFKSLFNLIQHTRLNKPKLPPGPPIIPLLTNLQWLGRSFSDLEPLLRRVTAAYGPIVTLQIGPRKSIFVSSHELAHKALVQQGATFADRPPSPVTGLVLNSNQHSVNSAAYGPLWRILRRNLSSEILHFSRVKSFSHARKWVFNNILKNKLIKTEANSSGYNKPIRVNDHFQFAMFYLLVMMCFGEKFNEEVVREIEKVQRAMLLQQGRINILNVFPKLGKFLLRNRWKKLLKLRSNQERVLLPLIKARQAKKNNNSGEDDDDKDYLFIANAYADTLVNLTIPEDGGRKLNDGELVTLCSELLNGGTDTTTAALQWIMANLVKHQEIQNKLYEEIIKEVVLNKNIGSDGGDFSDHDDQEMMIREDDLQKMPYLKAVVLEGLRRHPPAHFVAPHAVTEEEVVLGGYAVPKDATINFMVAEMGWDPRVWEDPMEFRPERFLGEEGFDITGSREIKMMPFGAGRRICPGLGFALLHLEYLVGNLVMEFEWRAGEGEEVDLSEKQELMVVMKYPLMVRLAPMRKLVIDTSEEKKKKQTKKF